MKRGIAGSMIFLMFDRHALLYSLRAGPEFIKFVTDKDEIRPGISGEIGAFKSTETGNANTIEAELNNFEKAAQSIDDGWAISSPWYSDQIPPFTIVLAGVNEMGAASTMSVFGVEILNEGYGISIDDIVSEQQMTYVARAIEPWTPVETPWGGPFESGRS